MRSKPPVRIDYSARFKKDLKRLYKKYRKVRDDVQAFLIRLEQGETPGDQVPGVKYPVYKARIQSSDLTKGKRGGYRVIYYVRTAERIFIVTMYVKAERADVSAEEIRRIIEEYEPPES